MSQLLALVRRGGRIELIDLQDGARTVFYTDTGPHPDGVVWDGTTVYWTTMVEQTSINSVDEAVYADGGVRAVAVDEERASLLEPEGLAGGRGRRDLPCGARDPRG